MNNYLVILCFLLIQKIKSEKIISIKYDKNDERPSSSLFFPKDNIKLKSIYLNTFVPKTVISIDKFGKDRSFLKEDSFSLKLSSTYTGWHYKTDIMLNTTLIPDTEMILFQAESNYCHDTGLSLAYKFENEQQSIIHILYNNHLIDQKVFSFDINENTLYLGGIPNKDNLTSLNHRYCKIDTQYSSWGCNLTSVEYNKTIFKFNNYSIFNSGDDDFIWSFEFFEFMINTIFINEIKEKKCKSSDNYQLVCNKNLEKFNESIIIEIGGMKIKVQLYELFKIYFEQAHSLFRKYSIHDTILVGFGFFKLFDNVIFDYDKGEVHFYSQVGRFTGIIDNKIIEYILLIVIYGCISCSLLLFLLMIRKVNYFN